MKKNINIVTGKMIREDTRIVFQKLNEMKTDWKTALDTLFSNDAVDYAVKSYSDYSKKAVADAGKTTELPKIDVAGQNKTDNKPATKSYTGMTFKQAFAKARKEAHGGKGQFEFGGKKYQTNIQGTGTKEKPQEKFISAGKQKVTSVKSGSDSSAPKTPETPKTSEAPKAQEAPKTPEATKSDTEKPKASVTVASPDTKPPEDAPINEPQNKGADGADGASVNGGKGGKGGKGGQSGQSLQECVQIGANKYRII